MVIPVRDELAGEILWTLLITIFCANTKCIFFGIK
jgi:hypothetical protein